MTQPTDTRGVSEGTWSVFAEKVVRERDDALEREALLRVEVQELRNRVGRHNEVFQAAINRRDEADRRAERAVAMMVRLRTAALAYREVAEVPGGNLDTVKDVARGDLDAALAGGEPPHRLPVLISSCWVCPVREEHLKEVLCDHPLAGDNHRRVAAYRMKHPGAPPTWCPMRGAR